MRFLISIAVILLINTAVVLAQQVNDKEIKSIYELCQNKPETALIVPKKQQQNFYKKHLSLQISATCQFQNTCSAFMSEAIHHKGIFAGFLLGIDRLSRCGSSDMTYNYLPSLKSSGYNSLLDDWYFYN